MGRLIERQTDRLADRQTTLSSCVPPLRSSSEIELFRLLELVGSSDFVGETTTTTTTEKRERNAGYEVNLARY